MEDAIIRFPFGKTQPPEITSKIERQKELFGEFQVLNRGIEAELAIVVDLQRELEAYAKTIAPINKVPDDVLLYTFLYVASGKYFQPDLVNLSEVCRRWRALSTQNPTLWTRIQLIPWHTVERTKNQMEYIKISLERSGNLPLDVEVLFDMEWVPVNYVKHGITQFLRNTFPSVKGSDFESELCRLAFKTPILQHYPTIYAELIKKLVGPKGKHMKRWRSAKICLSPDPYKRLWSLFNGQTPQLKKLKVQMGAGVTCPVFTSAKKGGFKRMQSLETLIIHRGVYLSSFHLSPKTLLHLTVHEVEGWSNFKFLSSFPQLRTLTYWGFLEDATSEPTFKADEKIYLPNLCTLTIIGEIPTSLLIRSDFPSLTSVRLSSPLLEMDDFPTIPFLAFPKDIKLSQCWKKLPSSHFEKLIQSLLLQSTSLVNLTVWTKIEDLVVRCIERYRETSPQSSPVQKVYIGDSFRDDDKSPTLIWDASVADVRALEISSNARSDSIGEHD